jgi:biotin carboxylase
LKNIMILGANYLQLPLIKRALEFNYNVIVVSPNLEEIGHSLATYSVKLDVRDQEKILEAARLYKIDAVVTDQTDIPVRTAAYIAEKMGLPGIGYETARIFTDKAEMRKVCSQNGILTMPYVIADNIEQALNFYKEVNDIVIIKPVDNQASKGIYKIKSEKDLIDKFDISMSFSSEKKVIIEKFILGEEVEIDTLVLDKDVKKEMVGDVVPFRDENVFAASQRSYPSRKPRDVIDKLRLINKRIISTFGLQNGITHGEYIVDKNGDIYLLEIAARGGGSYISSHIWYTQTGIRVEDVLIRLALGEKINLTNNNNQQCVTCYISSFLPEGKVIDISGISELDKVDYIIAHSFDNINLGMQVSHLRDKTARFIVVLAAPNYELLNIRINEVKEMLRVRVDTGTKIEGPIWE